MCIIAAFYKTSNIAMEMERKQKKWKEQLTTIMAGFINCAFSLYVDLPQLYVMSFFLNLICTYVFPNKQKNIFDIGLTYILFKYVLCFHWFCLTDVFCRNLFIMLFLEKYFEKVILKSSKKHLKTVVVYHVIRDG